jgi:hypothetical protein
MTQVAKWRNSGGFASFLVRARGLHSQAVREVVMTATRGLRVAMLALVGTAMLGVTPAMAQGPFPRRDDRGTIQRDRRDPRDTRGAGTIWDRRTTGRFDLAFNTGENDGYKEGLKDGEKGDRFDPVREKKYRSADSGYDKRYGSKEAYKNRYRDGYRRGYELGYQDGRRYDRRDSDRNRNRQGSSWWPFGR